MIIIYLYACLYVGWGVDQEVIIWILGHRKAVQRKKIKETYQQLFKESIIHCLQSTLSGVLGKAMSYWMEEPPERDAKLVEKTLKRGKAGITQLQVIVEIACASSPNHLMAVRQAYYSLFDCSLEEAITSKVSSSLQKVVHSLRYTSQNIYGFVISWYDRELVDLNVAKSEAAKLHEAIEKKQSDRDEVMWILSTRNFFQLRATFKHYKQNYQAIMSSGSDDLGSLLRVVILCIDAPEKHFAEVIRASLSGHRTDVHSLARAILARVEIDMMKIKEEYFNMNKVSLDDAVVRKTSGGYKDFLMTLIGARI
ncbi:hypothetical protein VitviT2T_020382 [Vitis vinifera]|uniref:Annexin D3 n=1 Tax=Vitis vinifera TaxID=29760 RepID=A0ABY9D3R0_VITVI|nr:hypothetical protein VitviT2T_020382 [Vitis vinifera]